MSQRMKEKPKYHSTVFCGSLDVLIWIKAKVEHRSCFPKNPRILQEFLSFGIPKDTYTIPNQSLELQRKPIKPP